ncbi:tripartite tricarboxylate transporter substrate binding protein [Acidovorax sp. A79]|uniref:Bug family tripartite tricarboxylate transporter substrate binding protein n=1 Tax=Acidovorax sp. A79 TaxID=3056107 RepID=UPI0034E86896
MMKPLNRRPGLKVLVALGVLLALPAWSQTWPVRPIKLIVPQAAGSGNDVLARTLAEQLGKGLGQSVVVENRPGANGSVAASYTVGQSADGYTLFLAGVSNLAWNPYLYQRLSYNPARDFAGVAVFANTQFVTLASPTLQVRSFAELVKKAKEAPGQISYASAGIGNSTHLSMELVAERSGMKLQHVPFNGAGATTSLMAGDTPVMTTVPGGITELVRTGKLVALAVTGDKRMDAFPNVPTFKELGYDVAVPGWYSIVAKTGTPPAIVQRLNTEINKAIQTPEVRERLAAQTLEPISAPASEVERLMQRDAAAWGPFIKKLDIAQ